MKYKLITTIEKPEITIDESVKEHFKKLMEWDEEMFLARATPIKDEINVEEIKREINKGVFDKIHKHGYEQAIKDVLEIINELRLKYRKVGSIKEQDFAQELKSRLEELNAPSKSA